MSARKPVVYESGNNIFADIGVTDPQTHMLKAQIVTELYRLTTERDLTQSQAGALMGLSQPEVSRLFKGTFREYSVERLMGFLTGSAAATDRSPANPRDPHAAWTRSSRPIAR